MNVGGKPRKGRDKNNKRGRGTKKAPVVGVIERGGEVIAKYMPKLSGKNLLNFVIEHIKPDESILMTDEYAGYNSLDGKVPRSVVNHKENYVDDDGVTHTNTIEGFWAGCQESILRDASSLHKEVDSSVYRRGLLEVQQQE